MVSQIDVQQPAGPMSVNDQFFDAMIRHQVGLLRLSGSIRNDVIALLNATEPDMVDKITARLANGRTGLNTPADVRRLQTLLASIRATRLPAWDRVDATWLKELSDLAVQQATYVDGALKTVVPVTLDTTLPSPARLAAIARTKPFEGKTLRQWAANARASDIARIEQQITIGMVQGESSQAIARRVVGTKIQRGTNGVTEITRRQAAAITRTAVMGVSNQSNRLYYQENEDLFVEELYTATLDARTTPICKSLDGELYPVGVGPIPPVHFNCRSVRVAVLDGEALGQRPAKPVTEQQLLREFSKQKGIATPGSRGALPYGTKGAFDTFSAQRIRELTGTVPAKVTYQQWLTRQSAAFQNDTLGQTRGALFRRGGLTLDNFVNRAGDEIPLSQLARVDADAFRAAGLDPEDFL